MSSDMERFRESAAADRAFELWCASDHARAYWEGSLDFFDAFDDWLNDEAEAVAEQRQRMAADR